MAATVRIDGDARSLLQEFNKLQRAYDTLQKETRETTRENAELGRIATRALREIQTPAERYERTLKELDRALQANVITTRQYERAVDVARRRLNDASESNRQAFGREALTRLGRFTAGFVSLGAAVQAYRALVAEARAEADELAQSQLANARTIGELAQVSDTQQEFRQNVAIARQIQARGVSEREAVAITFALDSANLKQDAELFGELAASGFIQNAPQAVRAVAQTRAAFGPEGLTSRQVLDALLAASGVTQANLPEVAQAVSRAAPAGALAGLNFRQVTGLVSQLSLTQEASEASTQVRALLTQLNRRGFRVQTADELINLLQQEQEQRGTFRRLIGEEQGAVLGAVNLLRDPEALRRNLQNITGARGITEERLGFIRGDDATRTALERQAVEQEQKLALERLGVRRNEIETFRARRDIIADQLGVSPLLRAFVRGGENLRESFGVEPAYEANVIALERRARSQGREDLLESINELREQTFELRRLNEKTPTTPTVPTAEAPAGQ